MREGTFASTLEALDTYGKASFAGFYIMPCVWRDIEHISWSQIAIGVGSAVEEREDGVVNIINICDFT